jgi:hypothetical protein
VNQELANSKLKTKALSGYKFIWGTQNYCLWATPTLMRTESLREQYLKLKIQTSKLKIQNLINLPAPLFHPVKNLIQLGEADQAILPQHHWQVRGLLGLAQG